MLISKFQKSIGWLNRKAKLTENDDFGPFGHELLIAIFRQHRTLIFSFYRATSHIRDEQIVDSLQKNVISFEKKSSSLPHFIYISFQCIMCLVSNTIFIENYPEFELYFEKTCREITS